MTSIKIPLNKRVSTLQSAKIKSIFAYIFWEQISEIIFCNGVSCKYNAMYVLNVKARIV